LASCSPETTRFVDVPISVVVPPSTVAKLMGMSSFLGLMPHLRCVGWWVEGRRHTRVSEGERQRQTQGAGTAARVGQQLGLARGSAELAQSSARAGFSC
jgi:hypothetical protein